MVYLYWPTDLANHLAKGTEAIQVLINRPALTSILLVCASVCLICSVLSTWASAQTAELSWRALPSIPDELGLAGPIVGVQDEILVAGGGANFARPVWDNTKQWHSALYVSDLRRSDPQWLPAGELPMRLAYSACASTPYGVAIIGGNDSQREYAQCWLLSVKRMTNGGLETELRSLPDLPQPLVYGQAVWMKDRLVVLTGQTGSTLTSAIAGGWYLQMNKASDTSLGQWQPIAACPGGARAFASACAVDNDRLWLLGGRRQNRDQIEFLKDVWQFHIGRQQWQRMADLPVAVAAGGAGCLNGQVAVVSGDDGSLFTQTEQLRDQHPGFAKRTWLFNPVSNSWRAGGPSPANQVTTQPVVLRTACFSSAAKFDRACAPTRSGKSRSVDKSRCVFCQ